MEIDYRKILVKYILYVGYCEGVDFISNNGIGNLLSDEENQSLIDASNETRDTDCKLVWKKD